MTFPGRDSGEIEALVTDRYLDALLAGEVWPSGRGSPPSRGRPTDHRALDAAVRAASRRLSDDLPRFHPSFRFEERLALRLAEAAAAMRLPMAAGAESQVAPIPIRPASDFDPLAIVPDDEDPSPLAVPTLIRGAVAASAISIAGAAWLAWRRRAAVSPMGRAARAAHADRRDRGRRPVSRLGRA
ncbi:MAG TPA: hypothetical protein VET90_00950 [Candidatus Binatus sp.]|nr:hypothetical protein [Candidatus Binatus sp.]